jgi:hypothetical protein
MDDYDEIQLAIEFERVAKGKPTHSKMDDAFCARMLKAIEAGLENAPVGAGRYGALLPLPTTMDD